MEENQIYYTPVVYNTVRLVAENISKVEACRGENLVVFIGREQVGKSTTINSLLGVHFQTCKQNRRILEPKKGEQIYAPMGCDEKRGIMCTVFPAVYKDPVSNLYYLDTQGFFGADKNPDEVAAASILLDAAIKSAATVKVIYTEDFEEFSKGFTRVQDAVKLLNRVALSDDVPIYCLFNRYLPPLDLYQDFIDYSDDEKDETIRKELENCAEKLKNAAKLNIEQTLARLKNVFNSPSDDSNTDRISQTIPQVNEIENDVNSIKEATKLERCAQIISASFEAGRFGHIDPKSDYSIQKLRRDILKLPVIDKSKLSFNCCDQMRIRFSHNFEDTLQRLSKRLNSIIFSLKFSPESIEMVINNLKEEIERCQKLLSKINSGQEVDLSTLFEQLYAQKIIIKDNIHEYKNKLDFVTNEIRRIIESEPIKYRDIIFNEPTGFLKFWRNYTVKYEDEMPFVAVDEYLAEGTFRKDIIDFDIGKFNIYNDNETERTFFELKNKAEPVSKFEVVYSSGSTSKKWRIGISLALSGLVGAGLSAIGLEPLSIPAGAACGLISGKIYNCTGVVSFYVRYQDKEKNVLEFLEENKEYIQNMLNEKQIELSKIKEQIASDQKQALTMNIALNEDRIEKLEEIHNFVKNILLRWNSSNKIEGKFQNMNEEFTAYYQIAKMLYLPPVRNESVNTFVKLFDALQNISPETDQISGLLIINEYYTKDLNAN